MRKTLACLFFFLPFLSVSGQTAADYTWKSVALGGAGFVSAIITCPTEQDLIYARTDVGGAYRWKAADQTWIPLNDWSAEDEKGYMGVESLAVDPREPNRVYMLVGTSYWDGGKTAILRSADYGENFDIVNVSAQFRAHGNGMGRQTGEKLAVDPNKGNILFTGTRIHGLFRSTNYGQNWTKVNSFTQPSGSNLTDDNGISFVLFDKSSSSEGEATKRIYAGVSKTGQTNLFVSSNAGETWSRVPGHVTTQMPMRAVLATNGVLYLTYANAAGPWNPSTGSVRKLDTRTGVWTTISPLANRPYCGITVDPLNPDRIVASTINVYVGQAGGGYGDLLYKSENGGSSWQNLTLAKDLQGIYWVEGHAIHWAGSVEFDPYNTSRVFVTSGNGIFMTEDVNTASPVWKFSVKNLEETVPLDMVSIPGGPVITVIGDYDGCTYEDSKVGEYVRVHNPQIGTTEGVSYASRQKNFVVRVGSRPFYSTDYGRTWNVILTNGLGGRSQGRIAVSADGEVVLWCPEGGGGRTYRTVNRGASWVQCTGVDFNNARPVADPVNEKVFYIYHNGSVYRSTDKGVSFSIAGSTSGGWGSPVIRTAPERQGHLWIAGQWGGWGVQRSVNGGETFSSVTGPTYCRALGFGRAAPGKPYPALYIWGTVGGITGLFRSTDEGSNWIRVNDDDHQFGGPGNGEIVMGDMNIYGRVYLGTVGRGVIYGDVPFAESYLTAVGKNKSILLSWRIYEAAQSYKILKGTQSGVYPMTNAGITVTAWEDTDVQPGVTYYYRVVAVSESNEWASYEVSASLVPSDKIEVRNNFVFPGSSGEPIVYLELADPDQVIIDVLDAGGSLVSSIEDGRLSSGFYSYPWSAEDGRGLPVPSGVYLVRILIGKNKPVIHKIMIVR